MTRKLVAIIVFLNFFLIGQSQKTGLIYLSSDEGQTWQQADCGLPEDAIANDFVGFKNNFYAATESHGIYRSNDRGKSWYSCIFGLDAKQKVDVLAANATTLFAGTYTGGIFMSFDGGQIWFPSNQGLTTLTIRSLDIRDDIIYAGTNDGLFASNDNGRTWRRLTEAIQINKLAFMDNKLFLATNKGALLSKDQGRNWEWIYQKEAIQNIAVHGNEIYAMRYGTEVWKTMDDGKNWLQAYLGGENNYTSAILSLGRFLIASRLSGLFISHSNGLSWEKIQEGLPIFKELKRIDSGTLIAATGMQGGC